MSYADRENELLTLLLDKLYRLRKAWIVEADAAHKFKLSQEIDDAERDFQEMVSRIEQCERVYQNTHKNLVRDLEGMFR